MRKVLITLLSLCLSICAYSQSAELAFHSSANLYINEKTQEAKNTLDNALLKYPNDKKLNELRSKIKEDEKKQEQEKKEQEKKEQEKQEQEKKEQDKKGQEKDKKGKGDKEQQEKDKKEKEQQEKEQQEKNSDKKDLPPSVSEKLKEMQMSEEKAKMILEAMKNQEVQYLQQNKRKATKPKDKGKPDW